MAKRRTTRRRTSLNRAHRASLIVSSGLLLTAVVAMAVGAYAWQLDRNPPTGISGDDPVSVGTTPLFDPGVTLFVREGELEDANPGLWGCSLADNQGRRALTTRGNVERSGTRVQEGEALVPALVIGKTSQSERLACSDLPAGTQAWSLPTDAGYPRVPMALVVGGVALAGASALTHPRTRGLNRFT